MRTDGTIASADGRVIPLEEAAAEVVWANAELFADGAGPFMRYVETAPTLRFLQSPGAGTELPVFGRLLRRGVRVCTTHVQSVAIAEFVLRSVLDHYQHAPVFRALQDRREWQRVRFREVNGTTWLIVGMGAIGSDIAQRAAAYGAHVIGVRRNPTGTEPCAEMIGPAELLAAVPRADVLVLAAPSTPETRDVVDRRVLAAMKTDAVLVNVARGALVDEAALLDALDREAIAGAILDVSAVEPLPPDHRFWGHPRVMLSAHTSAMGSGTHARAAFVFTRNLRAFLDGQPLEHELSASDFPAPPQSGPHAGP
jgi:phosphoglycerate dehydrogenase-like enzyme